MIRVTTNGTLYNYKSSFNQTANQLNSAMMKLMTGRNFDTYAANPAGATRAFQIHSSINATNAQYDNNQTVLSKFQTAWSSIQGVLDGFDGLAADSRLSALSGLNDTNPQHPGPAHPGERRGHHPEPQRQVRRRLHVRRGRHPERPLLHHHRSGRPVLCDLPGHPD